MSEQLSTPPQEATPDQWSEEAHNEERDKHRPTAENPVMFDIEDAMKSVSFQQIAGETLYGVASGYFYNESGDKINLIALNNKSAEKAGWNTSERGYMKVPESAIENRYLTDAQEDIAGLALEGAGIELGDE